MAQSQVCVFCRHESAVSFAACPLCGREAVALGGAGSGGVLICYKCDFETEAALTNCPRCRHALRKPSYIRVMGAILLVIGLFLVALMGTIAYFVADIIAHTDDPGATTRFDGGPKEIAIIFGIFGLVIAFGAACMAGGLWQVVRGRRNKKITMAVLVIAVLLGAVAGLVQVLL